MNVKHTRAVVVILLMCLMLSAAVTVLARTFSSGYGMNPEEALVRLKKSDTRFVACKATHPHQIAARLSETARADTLGHPWDAPTLMSPWIFSSTRGWATLSSSGWQATSSTPTKSTPSSMRSDTLPVILVLGQTSCGTVTAVVQRAEMHGSIPALVDNIKYHARSGESQSHRGHWRSPGEQGVGVYV